MSRKSNDEFMLIEKLEDTFDRSDFENLINSAKNCEIWVNQHCSPPWIRIRTAALTCCVVLLAAFLLIVCLTMAPNFGFLYLSDWYLDIYILRIPKIPALFLDFVTSIHTIDRSEDYRAGCRMRVVTYIITGHLFSDKYIDEYWYIVKPLLLAVTPRDIVRQIS